MQAPGIPGRLFPSKCEEKETTDFDSRLARLRVGIDIDYDMTSYALVRSFPATDARSQRLPAWEPKRAFFRLGEVYNAMNSEADSVKKT